MSTVVQSFTVAGPFAENCYVCHSRGEAVLLDPGCADARERNLVLNYIAEHNLAVRHLLLTHAHLDHIVSCAFFADHFGLGWQMHPDDAPLLRHAEQQAALFQFPIDPPPDPTGWLREGATVTFGDATVVPREVFHKVASPRIQFPDVRDLVVLRVTVKGRREGHDLKMVLEVIDFEDPATGFSAMQRTTGWAASIVSIMQAEGEIRPGAIPLEIAVDGRAFVDRFTRRGIPFTESMQRSLSDLG